MKHILSSLFLLASTGLAHAEVVNIDNAEMQRLIAAGVPIVDVRTPQEWQQTGVVAGSNLLTFFDAKGRYDAVDWVHKLQGIAKADEPVILICRTGNRTSNVAAFLSNRVGYAKVYNLKRGIVQWIAEKRPVVAPTSERVNLRQLGPPQAEAAAPAGRAPGA